MSRWHSVRLSKSTALNPESFVVRQTSRGMIQVDTHPVTIISCDTNPSVLRSSRLLTPLSMDMAIYCYAIKSVVAHSDDLTTWPKNLNHYCRILRSILCLKILVCMYLFSNTKTTHKTFLHSHSYFLPDCFTDLNLYWVKGALALFVLVSGYVC